MTTTPTGLTFADVLAALGDTNPNATNAGALRQVLGRGSFATIQKHLDQIRANRAPPPPIAPGAAPPPPADAISLIWSAAWSQAQALTLGRLETMTAERDAALSLASTRAQDVAALSLELDTSAAAASAQASALAAATEATEAAKALTATLQAEIEHMRQSASLAARDATIERQTLQAALDRQLDKYTELKSLVRPPPSKPKPPLKTK